MGRSGGSRCGLGDRWRVPPSLPTDSPGRTRVPRSNVGSPRRPSCRTSATHRPGRGSSSVHGRAGHVPFSRGRAVVCSGGHDSDPRPGRCSLRRPDRTAGRGRGESREAVEIQRSLSTVGAALASLHDPAAVLRSTVDVAVRLLEADGALLDLVDPDTGKIRWAHDAGSIDEASRQLLRALEIEAGEGMFGRAIATGEVHVTGDYLGDGTFVHAEGSDEFVREDGRAIDDRGAPRRRQRTHRGHRHLQQPAGRVRRGRHRPVTESGEPGHDRLIHADIVFTTAKTTQATQASLGPNADVNVNNGRECRRRTPRIPRRLSRRPSGRASSCVDHDPQRHAGGSTTAFIGEGAKVQMPSLNVNAHALNTANILSLQLTAVLSTRTSSSPRPRPRTTLRPTSAPPASMPRIPA